jgi:plastocyanin
MTRRATISSFRRLRASMVALSLSSALAVAADAAEVTYALTIANGRLPENMRLIRVKQNDVVKLEWRTDKPLTVHLHGYDIEQELKPGAATDMTFTARATGRFTVEPHIGRTPSGGHAHGDVLATIEVYP